MALDLIALRVSVVSILLGGVLWASLPMVGSTGRIEADDLEPTLNRPPPARRSRSR